MNAAAVDRWYWLAAIACALGGALGLTARALWKRAAQARRVSGVLATTLLLLAAVAWVLRWRLAGHMPMFGAYESGLSLALAVLGASWLWEVRGGFRAGAWPVAALLAAAVLVHAGGFSATPWALTISERSWAVDVHALCAWSAFGMLTVNAALALRALFAREPDEARGRAIARTLDVGFLLHTGLMVSGSFYSFLLFGKAWSFDPIETMGLVAWLAYGTLIHMARFAGWQGKRLAGYCVFVFVLLVVSYRFIVYFPATSSYHILDIDLRSHAPR